MKNVSVAEMRAVEGGATYTCRHCGGKWSGLLAYTRWKKHWNYSAKCLVGYELVYGHYPDWVKGKYLEKLGLK